MCVCVCVVCACCVCMKEREYCFIIFGTYKQTIKGLLRFMCVCHHSQSHLDDQSTRMCVCVCVCVCVLDRERESN